MRLPSRLSRYKQQAGADLVPLCNPLRYRARCKRLLDNPKLVHWRPPSPPFTADPNLDLLGKIALKRPLTSLIRRLVHLRCWPSPLRNPVSSSHPRRERCSSAHAYGSSCSAASAELRALKNGRGNSRRCRRRIRPTAPNGGARSRPRAGRARMRLRISFDSRSQTRMHGPDKTPTQPFPAFTMAGLGAERLSRASASRKRCPILLDYWT